MGEYKGGEGWLFLVVVVGRGGGTVGVNSVKKQFVPRVKRSGGSVVDHTLVF